MQRLFRYQVICLLDSGARCPYTGSVLANSENEVRAYIMRNFSNIIDIQIW